MNRITKTLSVALLAFAVGVGLAAPGTAWAKHKHTGAIAGAAGPDPTAVNGPNCPTSNLGGTNTIYYLTGNLSTTSTTANCINLTGDRDALLLNGYTISGPGSTVTSGAGIRITGDNNVVEGFNAFVTGFRTGISDSGGNTVGDDVNIGAFPPSTTLANGTGLLMMGGTDRWGNFSVSGNTGTGIFLNGCSDECTIFDFSTTDNGGDGLLIQNGDQPSATVFIAADNAGNAVHLGGTSFGKANTSASVLDAFIASPNGVSDNTGNGVLLDTSESTSQDQVSTVNATGNGDGTTTFDLRDATASCGNNLWYNNSFGTSSAGAASSPACIGGLGS
ncbi:hypothetical protein [Candidatus Binatus sp.]|uniref:hypothetical protein n=1 Tax=Candidatus Binatus sp. TaxID=2811406 RepID=UPI002F95FC61